MKKLIVLKEFGKTSSLIFLATTAAGTFSSLINMELVSLQIIFMFVLFIMTLVASLWPLIWIKIIQHRKGQEATQWTLLNKPAALSIGNCVACGAFTALCFLHLLPESETKWKLVLSSSSLSGHNNHSTSDKDSDQESDSTTKISSVVAGSFILVSFTLMFAMSQFFAQRSESGKATQKIPIIGMLFMSGRKYLLAFSLFIQKAEHDQHA